MFLLQSCINMPTSSLNKNLLITLLKSSLLITLHQTLKSDKDKEKLVLYKTTQSRTTIPNNKKPISPLKQNHLKEDPNN